MIKCDLDKEDSNEYLVLYEKKFIVCEYYRKIYR